MLGSKDILFQINISVTVQPCISYIHKPASELSVAALQLMFTHFRNERLFYHKKVLNNTMNKLIVLPIIFLWLNCYLSMSFLPQRIPAENPAHQKRQIKSLPSLREVLKSASVLLPERLSDTLLCCRSDYFFGTIILFSRALSEPVPFA